MTLRTIRNSDPRMIALPAGITRETYTRLYRTSRKLAHGRTTTEAERIAYHAIGWSLTDHFRMARQSRPTGPRTWHQEPARSRRMTLQNVTKETCASWTLPENRAWMKAQALRRVMHPYYVTDSAFWSVMSRRLTA